MGANIPVRDAEAAKLRAEGWTYQRIANEMGYTNASGARKAVMRGLARSVREPYEEARHLALMELDELAQEAWKVLRTVHYAVSQGRVVRKQNGTRYNEETGEDEPVWVDVLDDKPVLEALDRLLKIQERRAKLLGLDAPARSEHTVINLDTIDAEIQRLEAQMEAHDG